MRRALVMVAAVALPVAVVPPAGSPAAESPPPAAVVAPEIGSLEQALPPGARNVLSVLRVFRSLSARNRVYREAHSVQRDMRDYYETRVAKAREMVEQRQHLHPSQLRAYVRTHQRLIEERDLVMAITEDEKRGAKYGFESRLQRELSSVLVRVPRVRDAMTQMRDRLADLESVFQDISRTLSSGGPLGGLVRRVDEQIARVEEYASLAQLVHGQTAATLTGVTSRVRRVLDQVATAGADAQADADSVIAEINGFSAEIGRQLDAGRSVRAGSAIKDVAEREAVGAIFGPGRSPEPDITVMADAIARGHDRHTAQLIGNAAGVLDMSEFNSMRDRVQAALLGNTLERISDICGRVTGLQRQIALTAAATGQPVPLTSTPCRLFRNPEALQAYLDGQRGATTTTVFGPPSTVLASTPTTQPEDPDERRRRELLAAAAGTYSSTAAVAQYYAGEGIEDVTEDGALSIDTDGNVAIEFTFSLTMDLEVALVPITAVFEIDPTTARLAENGLVFAASGNSVGYERGQEYSRQPMSVSGTIEPEGTSVSATFTFAEGPPLSVTFLRD